MKQINKLTLLVLLATSFALSGKFTIDNAHSNIIFKIKHLGISTVTGNFKVFSGSIDYDVKSKKLSSVETTISAKSINTGLEKRDGHLQSPDFFDVAKFPNLKFVTKKIEGSGKAVKIHGELTMHGITKPIVLDAEFQGSVKDQKGKMHISFVASSKLNRKEYGLKWNKILEAGNLVAGEEVRIILEIEAVE